MNRVMSTIELRRKLSPTNADNLINIFERIFDNYNNKQKIEYIDKQILKKTPISDSIIEILKLEKKWPMIPKKKLGISYGEKFYEPPPIRELRTKYANNSNSNSNSNNSNYDGGGKKIGSIYKARKTSKARNNHKTRKARK